MPSGLLLLALMASALPAAATADQASQPASPAAGHIATGKYHTCAVLADATVRCWGYGGDGALGYGNTSNVGDDETPGSVGRVDLGAGRTARAISAGDFHTCALLDDGSVRCWGFGGDGRLGYGDSNNIGAGQTPGSVGPVDLGQGRTARAISAGGSHTCALLDDGSVRCWGFGGDGRLGYANTSSVGASQTPGSVGPVDLGPGRTAKAISAGGGHTCALLDNGTVRCWGFGFSGQLGYGNQDSVGDDETPGSIVDPVDLGRGRTAKAISAGARHTCAVLDDGTVRCWGLGGNGRLGYANVGTVGDRQPPGSVGPVDLGPGRSALAISAGGAHTCSLLDDGTVRCWGYGVYGQLGYANTNSIGDSQTPASVGPVDIGLRRTAVAISAGDVHTCGLLDDTKVRCWGSGAAGRLGYCSESNVGDRQTPGSVGPVNLVPGDGGTGCTSTSEGDRAPGATPGAAGAPSGGASSVDPFGVQALRAHGLHSCLARATREPKHQRPRARSGCLKRYGRRPGRVTGLEARAVSATQIVLSFAAPGSDGPNPPPARAYLIKQSRRPIRRVRDFRRAHTLCQGNCRFDVTALGTRINLTITRLRPRSTYYYAIAARDNVSRRPGPRSPTTRIRTG